MILKSDKRKLVSTKESKDNFKYTIIDDLSGIYQLKNVVESSKKDNCYKPLIKLQ